MRAAVNLCTICAAQWPLREITVLSPGTTTTMT
jgi:hypothetical protein